MKTTDNFSLIETYLDNELSGSDLISFEEELKRNFELQKELQFQKEVNQFVGLHSFRENIKKVSEEYFTGQKIKISFWSKYKIQIAATFLICFLLLTVYVVWSSHKKTTDELFNEYYKPMEFEITLRGSEAVVLNLEKTAVSYYLQKKYNQALKLFNEILLTDSLNSKINIYAGISAIELNQINKAIQYLSKVPKITLYYSSAQWYIGLCYLKLGDKQDALRVFENLCKDDTSFKNQALELINKIKLLV